MRFWHPEVPAAQVERARRLLVIGTALDTVRKVTWLREARAPSILRIPFGPLDWLGVPRLHQEGLTGLWLAVIVCAGFALRGSARSVRFATLILAVLYGWWAADHYSYGEPSHSRTALVTALVAFAFAPVPSTRADSGAAGARQPVGQGPTVSGWPIEILTLTLALLFLSATWAKLTVVGVDWWHDGATQAGIALWGPSWSRSFTAAHPGIVDAAAFGALVAEPLVGAGLVIRWSRRYAAMAAVGFHVVVLLAMGVDFLPMAWCAGILVVVHPRRTPDRPDR